MGNFSVGLPSYGWSDLIDPRFAFDLSPRIRNQILSFCGV
ncbi:hypothetical protein D082_19110 [Synechocystis sp. PCC 6714]|nr:hypothetical protein D082_19110 [Synechocystis sp. PCC 6714]